MTMGKKRRKNWDRCCEAFSQPNQKKIGKVWKDFEKTVMDFWEEFTSAEVILEIEKKKEKAKKGNIYPCD